MPKLRSKRNVFFFSCCILIAAAVGVRWRLQYIRAHNPMQTAFVPSSDRYGAVIDRMAFSPDGRSITLEDVGFDLSVWDVKKEQWTQQLTNKTPSTPEYASLSAARFPKQYVWNHEPVLFPPDIPGFPPLKPMHRALSNTFHLDDDDRQIFIAASPSRDLAAYAMGGGIVSVADLRHKRVLFTTPVSPIIQYDGGTPTYADSLCGLCFSADSALLATASVHNDVSDGHAGDSEDKPGPTLTIALRNARTGAVIRQWSWERFHKLWSDTLGQNSRPVTMAFSPDSKCLAVAGDTQIKLWNTATGALLKTFQDDGDGVFPWTHRLVFFQKHPLMASSGWNGKLQIWNTQSGRLVQVFQAQPVSYYGLEVALSPDERLIANSGRTEHGTAMLQVWDISNL